MLAVVVQTILVSFACYALWRLLRSVASYGRAAALIVTGGFLARALLGQLLFWISYLRLPVARSLQLGPGFWFFGLDAEYYFDYALRFADDGPLAIVKVSEAYSSRIFLQVLALFITLFGAVPAVGILLNCLTYAAICILIARLGTRNGAITLPALVGLAAISFSPAAVLWSTQPLKDTFMLLLILATIAVTAKWHELWTASEKHHLAVPLIASAVLLVALLYSISTIRWYVGILILFSFPILFVWQMIMTKRRVAAILVNALMFVFLAKAALAGGASDVPDFILQTLNVRTAPAGVAALPRQTLAAIDRARTGFEVTPGATNIAPGEALVEKVPAQVPIVSATETAPVVPTKPVIAEKPRVTPEPATPPSQPAIERVSEAPAETAPIETAAAKSAGAKIAKTAPVKPVPVKPAPAETAPATPPATDTVAATTAPAPNVQTSPPPAHQATEVVHPPAVVPSPRAVQTTTVAAATEIVAPPKPKPASVTPKRKAKTKTAAKPPVLKVESPKPVAAPAPAPAVVAVPKPAPVKKAVKTSVTDRVITGVVATVIPRVIAQRVGLIRVEGGRGFWFFADVDTFVFDIVLIFAIVYCARRLIRTRGRMTPMFVQAAIVFMTIGLPVMYAVNNFGTLFRHRQMIYLGLCLLPIALASRSEERTGEATTADREEPPVENTLRAAEM